MIYWTIEFLCLGFVETPHGFGLTSTLHVYKIKPIVDNPDSLVVLLNESSNTRNLREHDERRVPLVNRDDRRVLTTFLQNNLFPPDRVVYVIKRHFLGRVVTLFFGLSYWSRNFILKITITIHLLVDLLFGEPNFK